jgi:two-component system, NarL family, sensor kinase
MMSRTRRLSRSLVVKFALSSFVVLLLMIVASLVLAQRQGRAAAVARAREQALIVGDGLASYVTPALANGQPQAQAALDTVIQRHLKAGTFVRVKLWAESGRIVYSDEPRLVGKEFELDGEDLNILRNGGTDASISNLAEAENVFERDFGRLLQVYVQIRATDGTPMLFETYSRYDNIDHAAGTLLKRFLPALLGGLLGLWLLQLPLARSLQRKLNLMQEESESRLVGALGVADTDRQLIAGELDSQVLVDLKQLGHRLSAAADRVDGQDPSVVRDMVGRSASEARRIARHLELTLVELYPSSLSQHGLAGALNQCAAAIGAQGIVTTVAVPPDLSVEADTERLLLAAAREGLRTLSTQTHSRVAKMDVVVLKGKLTLSVWGDGTLDGHTADSDPTDASDPVPRAERLRSDARLSMVRELIERAGGSLTTGTELGGTFIRATVPARQNASSGRTDGP